jgi:hypothetical protein
MATSLTASTSPSQASSELIEMYRVPVEYSVMSKLKSGVMRASSSLLVLALLAFSPILGASASHAEDMGVSSCPAPALDVVPDLAEELYERCLQTAADAAPLALEGYAIQIEITQSVTIATLGQSFDLDVTGSVSSVAVAIE